MMRYLSWKFDPHKHPLFQYMYHNIINTPTSS
jgi:hypothetical protein